MATPKAITSQRKAWSLRRRAGDDAQLAAEQAGDRHDRDPADVSDQRAAGLGAL